MRARLLAMGLAATMIAAASAGSAEAADGLRIDVLSTRADLVSGGVALVSVTLPPGVQAPATHVTVNGSDATPEFAVRPNGRYEGLLTGLKLGANAVIASVPGGASAITITNHPIGGPVFAGPQIQPWTCQSGATDAQCDMPTAYAYEYKNAATGQFDSYDPSNPPPAPEVASTTTDNGQTVPYIIRIETGYQDRDEYQVAVLFTPGGAWQPWAPQPQWDGKLEIPGGASCGVNHGASTPPSVTDDTALSRGMMVAAPTLDNNGQNCNIVVQAEAVEMMKEHIVDAYGPVRYTIGSGCSGGSIYQQQVANAYPGLLDGILPMCSFPDSWSTSNDPFDCALLLPYWNTSAAVADGWTEAEKNAVVDDSTESVCQSWVNVYMYSQGGNPSQTNSTIVACGVGATQPGNKNTEYNAQTNPDGVRCDLQDYMPNVFGLRPSSVWDAQEKTVGHGFVNRPWDNTGVQYGLTALLAGTISPQQFTDLNAGVGCFDLDLNPIAQRCVADPGALQGVYQSGALNEANELSTVPIIDLRGFDDSEIHSDFRSYVTRARLDARFGGHGNQAIWTGPIALEGFEGPNGSMASQGFLAMDQWLANISNDHSNATAAQKVVKDRPAAATDTCFDATGDPLPDQSVCATAYPYFGAPRIAAGEPFTDDIMKCQLKPLSKADYSGVTFTDAEWSALQQAFPSGVCDWKKSGAGQQLNVPWQTYQHSDGSVIYQGTPLGPAPVSQPVGAPPSVPETLWEPALLMVGLFAAALFVRERRRPHA